MAQPRLPVLPSTPRPHGVAQPVQADRPARVLQSARAPAQMSFVFKRG